MKIVQIALNRSAHGIFLNDSDTLKLTYERDTGVTLEHNGKKYPYGFLMWPHYEFENQIGRLTCKLMSVGKGVNYEGRGQYSTNNIEFKPCKKMVKLHADLLDMENSKTKYARLRLMGVISRAKNNFLKSSKTTYEMTVAFSGHYESGSYVHDYTAAADYLVHLHKKFPDLQFEWLRYNSSNSHAYIFKFYFTA